MAPRRSQDISTYVEGSRIYLCDCPVYCLPREPAGKPKIVGAGTFFAHTSHRLDENISDMYIVKHRSAQGRERVVRKRRNLKDPSKGQPSRSTCNGHEFTSNAHEDIPMADAFPTPEAGTDRGAPSDRDAPAGSPAPPSYRTTVEEVPDEGEPGMYRSSPSPGPIHQPDQDDPMLAHPDPVPENPAPDDFPMPGLVDDDSDDEEEEEDVSPGNYTTEGTDEVMADEAHVIYEDQLPEARMKDLKIAQEFIRMVKNATLDKDQLDPEVLERLRRPPKEAPDISCPSRRFSLDVYLALEHASQDTYEDVRQAASKWDMHMLSYYQVKNYAAEITGIVPIYQDMCINTCVGFTGPFKNMQRCPICAEKRFEMRCLSTRSRKRTKVPRRRFLTIPVGPQLQNLFRTKEGAEAMEYREKTTAAIMKELKVNGFKIPVIKDYTHGSEYVEKVLSGTITNKELVLLLSMDGAQLYAHKNSDCWIYIWVVLEHSPDTRYKKKHVLVGAVIPGPNKPKNVDSFLFPGLYHVNALMKDGFNVWNAKEEKVQEKRPYLAFATADSPGMCYLNGGVGHKGAQGCRLSCAQKGRLKPGGSAYYPAALKPLDYNIEGSDHPDVILQPEPDDPDPLEPIPAQRYLANMRRLLECTNMAEYRQVRLETGFVKPSIFSGLEPSKMFPLPGCFPGDIMHLIAINIPDILFKQWRGKMACASTDDKNTWDWATFVGDAWQVHGDAVAAVRQHLPGSFDRPPRNPVLKINSGYKAVEFLTYLYGLGPVMFRDLLPDKYWRSYCKLVRGVRILHQRVIHVDQLREAHRLLIEFCYEYEQLYYQRNADRLHFVRQSIHALIHMGPETVRIGPYIIVSQWTMERVIGDLVRDMRQPSRAFENIAEVALRRAQKSALLLIYPDLGRAQRLPYGTLELADGFSLRRAAEPFPTPISREEADAIIAFAALNPVVNIPDAWKEAPVIARWARAGLPTRQIARSVWGESRRNTVTRISSNIKFMGADNKMEYGKVEYYFKYVVAGQTHGFAMIKPYGPRDEDIYQASSQTAHLCSPLDTYLVIPVSRINQVVAAIPQLRADGQLGELGGPVFMVEKMGLDVMPLTDALLTQDEDGDTQMADSD